MFMPIKFNTTIILVPSEMTEGLLFDWNYLT